MYFSDGLGILEGAVWKEHPKNHKVNATYSTTLIYIAFAYLSFIGKANVEVCVGTA